MGLNFYKRALCLLFIAVAWGSFSGPVEASQTETELLQTSGQAEVAKPAPWFAGWTLDQDIQNLSGLPLAEDTPTTVVVFFATWCQPCEVGLSILKANEAQLKQAGASVLLISVDERDADIRSWLNARSLTWRTVHDHAKTIATAYGVATGSSMRLPLTVVIGAERQVLGIFGTEGDDFLDLILALTHQERARTQP